MLRKEGERALLRKPGGVCVIARPLIAIEGVAGGVDVDLTFRALLQHDLNIRHRDRLVAIAEMQLRRHLRF